MSVIEQAAKRLQELRKAGVGVEQPEVPLKGKPISESSSKGDTSVPSRRVGAGLSPQGTSLEVSPSPILSPQRQARSSSSASAENRIVIDLQGLAEKGIVTPSDPRALVSEEFRVIKRPLLRNAAGKTAGTIKNANLIMVTSALPGEGKTTSALSLAMSIALEMDKTVLLVDADVAKPSVLRVLGIEERRGLLDVLVDDSVDLSDVLLRTNVENLVVLPSGRTHARATELLASDDMAHLVDEIAGRYPDRIIVFDSPPLLLTNEARVLAAHMGQIVIVVESGRTLNSSVQQALTTIETCPVKLLMLNKMRGVSTGNYYG
ncbi:MAG: XrtA-associated tyrosine autokinase, partial [Rhodocyclaceae bacterium]